MPCVIAAIIAAFALALPASAIDLPISESGMRVAPTARAVQRLDTLPEMRPTKGALVAEPFLPVPSVVPEALRALKADEVVSVASQLNSADLDSPAPPDAQDFEALPSAGTIEPPDTNGAVGPYHLLAALNDRVRVQDKNGGDVKTVGLTEFWSSLGISRAVDPRVVYDPHSNRFFFVAVADNRMTTSGVVFGVSATSNPAGAWYLYKYDADALNLAWADYPNLGLTRQGVTFTVNMFSLASTSFSGVRTFVIDKNEVLNGGPGAATEFYHANLGGNFIPCLTFGDESIQYLVSVTSGSLGGSGYLSVFRIEGPVSAPVFVTPDVYPEGPNWSNQPPRAPQKGTATRIATNDDRILNALLRDGRIWCAHTVGLPATAPTRTAVQWWRIVAASGVVEATGRVEDPEGQLFFYFPTIAANHQGEVLIGYSGSGYAMYPSAFYSMQSTFFTGGQMSRPTVFQPGEGAYEGTRWGDYSATCVDPADDLTLWTLQQYAITGVSTTWSTRWARLEGQPAEGVPAVSREGLALLVTLAGALAAWWLLHRSLHTAQ
jgi:hypothetical protein